MSEKSRKEEEKRELELMKEAGVDPRDIQAQRERFEQGWKDWHDYERQRSQGDGK